MGAKEKNNQVIKCSWSFFLTMIFLTSYAQHDSLASVKYHHVLDIQVPEGHYFSDLGTAFRNPLEVEALNIVISDSNKIYLLKKPELSFTVFTNLKALQIRNFGGQDFALIIISLNKLLLQQCSNKKLTSLEVSGSFDFPLMPFVEYLIISPDFDTPESILRFPNVRNLLLGGASITHLPHQINTLTKLETFVFSSGAVKTLPEEIGQLSKLRSLELQTDSLTELPLSIGNLSNLYEFNIKSVFLNRLPDSFSNLKRLKLFFASSSTFKSFPPQLFSLDSLQQIELGVGEINFQRLPSEICSFKQLEVINVGCDIISKNKRRRMIRKISACLPSSKICIGLSCTYNNQ